MEEITHWESARHEENVCSRMDSKKEKFLSQNVCFFLIHLGSSREGGLLKSHICNIMEYCFTDVILLQTDDSGFRRVLLSKLVTEENVIVQKVRISVRCSELHYGFGTVGTVLENTHNKQDSLVSVGIRVKNRSITKRYILSFEL